MFNLAKQKASTQLQRILWGNDLIAQPLAISHQPASLAETLRQHHENLCINFQTLCDLEARTKEQIEIVEREIRALTGAIEALENTQ